MWTPGKTRTLAVHFCRQRYDILRNPILSRFSVYRVKYRYFIKVIYDIVPGRILIG